MLEPVPAKDRLAGVQPNDGSALDVGVQVDVIRVNVVLDHVLVDPVDGAATDPVQRESPRPVDPRAAR